MGGFYEECIDAVTATRKGRDYHLTIVRSRMKPTKFLFIAAGLLAGIMLSQALLAQSLGKPNDPYPKVGVITAGDFWDTFAPTWVRKTYYET